MKEFAPLSLHPSFIFPLLNHSLRTVPFKYTSVTKSRREGPCYEAIADRNCRRDTVDDDIWLGRVIDKHQDQETSRRDQDRRIEYRLGSIYLGLITLLFAVPLGVGAALYLEEYGTRSWLAKLIQINLSNLAGVPSVVFGILSAFIFVELIFKPLESDVIAARNVLGGGMTLALLTLPVVIVAAQEAIRAVPPSLRHGAYALGATRGQVTWRLVLPCATPGILTGTILALARAMGEAAPLVMFGALLFVNQEPTLFSRFTVLPMQIFGWADRPDPQWQANAALASIILLITLLSLNGLAIWQRARSKIRW